LRFRCDLRAIPAFPTRRSSDLGFLGLGMLLAFTPCVFPMYPILAATLSREGESLTAGRGFALSLTYVLALAAAFSLFGVVAAWRSEEHTSEIQSREKLVCRLLL